MVEKSFSLSSFDARRNINKTEKIYIAKFITENLTAGETIFLGAGTTLSFVAEEIAKRRDLQMMKIWTNNLAILNLWFKKYEWVFLNNFVGIVSGELSSRNMSVINLSLPFNDIPKLIMGTPGISSAKGLSADDIYTVEQVGSLIKRAETIILAVDRSKIGRNCTYETRSRRMLKLDIKKGKSYLLVTNRSVAKNESPQAKEELKKLQEIGFKIEEV